MKICIVKLSAMGDIIHTSFVLQYIKKNFHGIQIDWVIEKSFEGVLQNNPHIDYLLPVDFKSFKKKKREIFTQYKLVKQYSYNNYDLIIDAQGLIKSALVSYILGGRVVGSRIVGFDEDSIREKFASKFYDDTVYAPYGNNVIERNAKLFSKALHFDITKEMIEKKESCLFFQNNFLKYKGYIVFVVGASKANKIYPKEKFLELSKQLEDEKIVVVWGNDEEYQVANWLHQNNSSIQVSSKTNYDQLKSIISYAKIVIGGDTGPTHMAWAMNIPSITIFGNTPGSRNTYQTSINRVIESNSYVDPLKLDKDDFSIRDIEVKNIVKKMKEITA